MKPATTALCLVMVIFAGCRGDSDELESRVTSALGRARSRLNIVWRQESTAYPGPWDLDCAGSVSEACIEAIGGARKVTAARLHHALDLFSVAMALCSDEHDGETDPVQRADLRVVRLREDVIGRSHLGLEDYLGLRHRAADLIRSLAKELEQCNDERRLSP